MEQSCLTIPFFLFVSGSYAVFVYMSCKSRQRMRSLYEQYVEQLEQLDVESGNKQ